MNYEISLLELHMGIGAALSLVFPSFCFLNILLFIGVMSNEFKMIDCLKACEFDSFFFSLFFQACMPIKTSANSVFFRKLSRN